MLLWPDSGETQERAPEVCLFRLHLQIAWELEHLVTHSATSGRMSEHSLNQPTEMGWERQLSFAFSPLHAILISETKKGQTTKQMLCFFWAFSQVGSFNVALSTAQSGCVDRLGIVILGPRKEKWCSKVKSSLHRLGYKELLCHKAFPRAVTAMQCLAYWALGSGMPPFLRSGH